MRGRALGIMAMLAAVAGANGVEMGGPVGREPKPPKVRTHHDDAREVRAARKRHRKRLAAIRTKRALLPVGDEERYEAWSLGVTDGR